MNKKKFIVLFFIVAIIGVLFPSFITSPKKVFAAHSRVDLKTTDNFAVLGGSAISDTGTTAVTGNVGLSPNGGTAITGLTCNEVTGTIYDTNGGYTGGGGAGTACLVTDTSVLTTAKNDLVTVYNDAAGRTAAPDIATNLGGVTLTDGTYHAASGTFSITGGQTLTLDGGGNADAVFIFKTETTLITGSSSRVVLTNSAQACNVYWQVGSSATLGTSTTFIGNIIALTSITDDGGSTINGRLLARNGAVTLNNTTIAKQTCTAGSAGAPTATPTPGPASNSTTGSSSTVCTDFAPTNSPDLFQIDRAGSKAVLYFTPANDYLSYYYVAYGLSPGDERFGVTFSSGLTSGVVTYTVNDLNPNTTYYFKVRGGNGCAPGPWSNNRESNSKSPSLPNTGMGPRKDNTLWYLIIGVFMGISALSVLVHRKSRCPSSR